MFKPNHVIMLKRMVQQLMPIGVTFVIAADGQVSVTDLRDSEYELRIQIPSDISLELFLITVDQIRHKIIDERESRDET